MPIVSALKALGGSPLRNLADIILAFFDLAEAEGKLLQTKVLQTVRVCLWFSLGIFFAAVSLGLFLASCFDWLLTLIPRPAAFALTGVASSLIALIFIGSSYTCLKKKKKLQNSVKASKEVN